MEDDVSTVLMSMMQIRIVRVLSQARAWRAVHVWDAMSSLDDERRRRSYTSLSKDAVLDRPRYRRRRIVRESMNSR